jgi:translation initiation factor IF-2
MIVGGRVEEGDIKRASKIAIFRGGVHIGTAEIEDLQQSKSAAQIVTAGNEFGVKLKTHVKLEEGDVVESFEEKLKSKTLVSRA